MTPITCSFCGFHHVRGYLFNRYGLGICRSCRDSFLSGLAFHKVLLTDANPMVAELCEESHVVPKEWHRFYNTVTQETGVVIQTKRRK